MEDKYIGFILAVASTIFIGSSFVVKKMGLLKSEGHGSGVSNLSCLKSPVWWVGTVAMAIGEVANFAAYSFAPAILVAPIGGMSVVISAVLAWLLLKERLDLYGKIGCALCLIGSTIIVLHAPEETPIESVDELMTLMAQPAFLTYAILVIVASALILWKVAPKWGKRNMLVYISVCSFSGSLTVVTIKGVGIALKLTFSGSNQFIYVSTYAFIALCTFFLLFQLNYLNLALDLFSAAAISPVYYVCFTACTILSNALLFKGFAGQTAPDVVNDLMGFAAMGIGVFLLYHPQMKPALPAYVPAETTASDAEEEEEVALEMNSV